MLESLEKDIENFKASSNFLQEDRDLLDWIIQILSKDENRDDELRSYCNRGMKSLYVLADESSSSLSENFKKDMQLMIFSRIIEFINKLLFYIICPELIEKNTVHGY